MLNFPVLNKAKKGPFDQATPAGGPNERKWLASMTPVLNETRL
jgi:hypothetical protein